VQVRSGDRRFAQQGLEVAVLLVQRAFESFAAALLVEEVGHADAGACDLVLVGGADAAARRPDLAGAA